MGLSQYLAPSLTPDYRMRHIKGCWVLNTIAFQLGFTRHPGLSWWVEYVEGRFKRERSDQSLHNEFFRWAGAIYDLRNSLRHQRMSDPSYNYLKMAVQRSLEHSGRGQKVAAASRTGSGGGKRSSAALRLGLLIGSQWLWW